MWRGHASALARYALACLEELSKRGRHYPHHVLTFRGYVTDDRTPSWLGDDRLHSSHWAALLRKDPAWYSALGWTDDIGTPLYWPI
jgi:hypothetical protein